MLFSSFLSPRRAFEGNKGWRAEGVCRRLRLRPKLHHNPYTVQYVWPETYGPWAKGVHYVGIRVPFWKEPHVLNYWPSTLLITAGGHSLSWENHFWSNNCTYRDLSTSFLTCITYLMVWWVPFLSPCCEIKRGPASVWIIPLAVFLLVFSVGGKLFST